jgi:hypothetical protein
MKSSLDFSQSAADWELAVFNERVGFTVSHHIGRTAGGSPRWAHEDFPPDQLREAIAACSKPTSNGKPRLLYCITAEGRQIVLDKANHGLWLRRGGF